MINNIELIHKIYNYVEDEEITKAVFACLRLSRNMNDPYNIALFLRELSSNKKEFDKAFAMEVIEFNDEFQDMLYKDTHEEWLNSRTMRYSLSDKQDETILIVGIGEMQKDLIDTKKYISELNAPSGMDPYDLAAFTDRYDERKLYLRNKITAFNTILERIRTRCLNYASRIEKQIQIQNKANDFLIDVQNRVNNYFSIHSDTTYIKLQKASSLVNSNNAEDAALLLTSVRRAISSVADYFYPPKKGKVICSDGQERLMGNEQYLNRLYEFCSLTFNVSTSDELIQAELNYFMEFIKKLNDIASKGVHSNVSHTEAKQGLIGLYMFLFNVVEKIENKNS